MLKASLPALRSLLASDPRYGGPDLMTMPTAGLKTIIALSFVLAVGFLLVILSCALWKVYYPLLVVATYVIAPLPNWICGRCANPDDFVENSGSAIVDLGRFCTGFLVVMGIGMYLLIFSRPQKDLTLTVRFSCSPSRRPRPLQLDRYRGHGHVDCRRPADLWNHHQLQHVLPGRAGILGGNEFRD